MRRFLLPTQECMAHKRFPFSWRQIGARAFRDRELEHEFRHVFALPA